MDRLHIFKRIVVKDGGSNSSSDSGIRQENQSVPSLPKIENMVTVREFSQHSSDSSIMSERMEP